MVVATYRPDELHRRHPLRPLLAELERGPRARRIELAPLTRAELAEQLEDILGAAPDDALRRRACTRAARATRSSPRSCWPPASTGAASCPRRCATRSWSASRRLARGRPGGAARARRRAQRWTTTLLAEAAGLEPARCARRCARRSAGQ